MADSREVAAFQRCYSVVQDGIQYELSEIVPRLYAKSLVSSGNRDKALSIMVPPHERAAHLLKTLESKIRVDPASFYSILQELQSCPTLKSLAEKLRSELEDQQTADQVLPKEIHDDDELYDVCSESDSEEVKHKVIDKQNAEVEECEPECKKPLVEDTLIGLSNEDSSPSIPSPSTSLTTSDHPTVTDTEQSECVTDCNTAAHAPVMDTTEHATKTEETAVAKAPDISNTLEMKKDSTLRGDTGEARQLLAQETDQMKCKKHDGKLEMFCFTCQCLICRDCIVYDYDHAKHDHNFVKEAAHKCGMKLWESLGPLYKALQSNDPNTNLTAAISTIQNAKKKVAENHATVSNTISQSINQMIAILQQREKDLLAKASELMKEKLEALEAQEESISVLHAETETMVEYVECILNSENKEELLKQKQKIEADLEESHKKLQQVDLQPAAKANIATDMSFDQQALIIGSVGLGIIDLTKCRAEFEGVESREVELKKPAQFTLHIVDSTSCPYKGLCSIVAEVKSHVDGSVVPAAFTPVQNGTYSATYTPQVRGRHYITVRVNRREMNGSPFSVFVRIPPAQLQKPVRMIDGVKTPCGIAINNNDEVLVAELDGARVSVFDKQGRKLRTIQHDKIPRPYGVTTDSDGNVYVCNREYDIVKFGKEGESAQDVKTDSGFLCFIRVISGTLYVCCGESDRVLLYDCNTLQPITNIGKKGEAGYIEFREPRDILSVNDKLYVSDRDNCCIQVFDQEGLNFELEVKNTSPQELCKPCGICVGLDGLLYVACCFSHCVLVFTLTGEFVASLGEVVNPIGIAVDSDGFVYVTCRGNQTVLVF